jgi:hypothetical protein
MYPMTKTLADGEVLDCSKHDYTLTRSAAGAPRPSPKAASSGSWSMSRSVSAINWGCARHFFPVLDTYKALVKQFHCGDLPFHRRGNSRPRRRAKSAMRVREDKYQPSEEVMVLAPGRRVSRLTSGDCST